ncbi:MAG TPA: hypothetical protein VIM75_10800, partial [Ohtaekwangia sp.]|uniref:hypothetical protein n=1 Tax=Ohtaekwangia sp. TaxID=2066019 RepID=UPI002F928253
MSMIKRCIVVCFFVFVVILNSIAQDLPAIIRPSPEAATLGKYGEIPVSPYTGTPNVNIPLYTIKDGDITVPISLSYHAGGIKVEEEAPWTGLGWSLMAGGSITRSIRGLDDFKTPYVGYLYNPYLPDPLEDGTPYQDFDGPLTTAQDDGQPSITRTPYYLSKNGKDVDYREWIDAMIYDWESDLYYFNVNDISDKFVFDLQGKVVLMKQQNLSLQLSANKATWSLTDEKGYTYTFGLPQISYNGNDEIVTAWYLTQIQSPNGIAVDFEYSHYQPGANLNDFLVKAIPSYFESKMDGGLPGNDCGNLLGDAFINYNNYQEVYLRKIKFRNGYIEFLRNSDFPDMEPRKDLLGAEQLSKIRIYEQISTDGAAALLKEYTFDYDYFVSGGDVSGYQNKFSANTEFDADKRGKRLKLVSITENGRNGTHKPPYVFDYDESVLLPPKASFSRDFWGYSNGKNNPLLVAEYQVREKNENGIEQLYYFFGADRTSDGEAMKAATLKRITYPTGGYTNFTYHVNEYSNFAEPEYENTSYGPFYFDQGKS